jgi:outer membrane protein OmpA-like peptidoglycan-associated protein
MPLALRHDSLGGDASLPSHTWSVEMRVTSAVLTVSIVFLASQGALAQEAAAPRPAIPTFLGDTGLWFVPTAEVVGAGGWSASAYRTVLDFNQGFTNLSYFPATFSAGLGSRVEAFGSLRTVTRIDRDLRPLFIPGNRENGGVLNGYPFVTEPWTGNDLGDLLVGGKVNLLSQTRDAAGAFAIRGILKIPTADSDTGAGTGELDYLLDAIFSREAGGVELTGFGGLALRGDPAAVDLSDSLRWGVGAGFGARGNLRVTTELFGDYAFDDVVWRGGQPPVGSDGSRAPLISDRGSDLTAAAGLTWQHSSGFFAGVGLSYRFGLENRSEAIQGFEDNSFDAVGLQVRIGYLPWRKPAPPPPAPAAPPVARPAPAPAPPAVPAAPPPAPAPANRPPTLTARCDPCRIPVGGTVNIVAQGQDPDGDQLTYIWSTAGGTIGNTRAASTTWRAETAPGTYTLTVVASDGRGGQATQTLTIEVFAPVAPALEILFDFDRSTIRPDAMPILDQAVQILNTDRTRTIRVEGHASAEGTDQYNQALSERRANAARDYLRMRGVDAGRIVTQGFGESRPRNANQTEAERRLNRRGVLIVVQ